MYRKTIWEQWDIQEKIRRDKEASDAAYVKLNNIYLAFQRGWIKMSVSRANYMRILVNQTYAQDDPMRDWWLNEFTKLPGWFNF